ncbi:MAG: manganese catalase family protein [Clostridia bacterium]|nr:manganese catalase family protein [Clostridia bacterium]
MSKPIRVDLPYPKIENAICDKHSATVISPAYCGLYGELSAILSYTYQNFNFKFLDDLDTAELFMGIGIVEMQHFQILGETLCSLGVDPIFTVYPPYKSDFYSTSSIIFSRSPEKMLMDAITGELVAINEYKRMLKCLKNEQVATVIERIVLDEELHVRVLKEKFNAYDVKIFY